MSEKNVSLIESETWLKKQVMQRMIEVSRFESLYEIVIQSVFNIFDSSCNCGRDKIALFLL